MDSNLVYLFPFNSSIFRSKNGYKNLAYCFCEKFPLSSHNIALVGFDDINNFCSFISL